MASQALTEDRKPVYEDVRRQIQELIRRGELRPGDKLPPERKLAETFQVSRNSVREAIRILAENEIVRSRHGDGTYICSQGETVLMDSVAQGRKRKRRRLEEIFEFRRLLEPQIASLAARTITRQEIDRLKLLVFEQERKLLTGQDDSDLDAAFHLCVAQAAKNTIIVQVLKSLHDILEESRSRALQSEERRRASLRTHVLIVDALERRDPEAARHTMILHLLQVEHVVLGRLELADGVGGTMPS